MQRVGKLDTPIEFTQGIEDGQAHTLVLTFKQDIIQINQRSAGKNGSKVFLAHLIPKGERIHVRS